MGTSLGLIRDVQDGFGPHLEFVSFAPLRFRTLPRRPYARARGRYGRISWAPVGGGSVVVDVRKVHPKTKVRKVPKKVQALKTSSTDLKSTLPLVYVSFADQACADEARQATDGRRMDGMVWEVEWAKAQGKK